MFYYIHLHPKSYTYLDISKIISMSLTIFAMPIHIPNDTTYQKFAMTNYLPGQVTYPKHFDVLSIDNSNNRPIPDSGPAFTLTFLTMPHSC